MLPESRKYKFPHNRKSVIVDSGTRRTEIVYEGNRILTVVVAELDGIVGRKKDVATMKKVLLEEVEHLEAEMNERIAYIKEGPAKPCVRPCPRPCHGALLEMRRRGVLRPQRSLPHGTNFIFCPACF